MLNIVTVSVKIFSSETAEVVIAIVETMGIPRDTPPETVLIKVLEGSQLWKKVLNITGKKKGKIEEHELVILVKNAIQKTFLKLKDKSISCKFVQYLDKNKTKVQEISAHMSKTDILIDELIICHEKLSHFQDDLIVIEKLMDFVVKNHVGIMIPYSAHLYDYVSQQRITIDDGTLTLLYLFQPSTYLKKIHNIAHICRRIELISTSCVFWNIVRQHLEKQPNMVNHIFLQFLCFGLNRNQDLDQEELKTSIISSTESIFSSISNECMAQFKHLWSDYRHGMKQNISETVQVFQRIENMESEIKTAEIICNFKLPDENRNSLIRFSRFKEYRKTVEQIKAVAKSFKFQETPNSKFKQTVTKFEKMMDGNFSNLTLKEITPVLDQIHNIMTIIKVNEDLSDILSAINDSSELLDFLREVIDEDIRNLIDAVEEHSEQYVRESTVSYLIEVKRFFHPMLNDDLNVNIGGLFKLLNKQHKDSGILQIPEKIRVCRDHLHSLMALYRNVANRGEHTVELIDKIMLKGTFHFKLEKRMCEVFVHYEHEEKYFKYKYMDLNDLRSRALLIMNAEKKCESDQKDLIKEQLNKFVALIDNAFEIQAICLNLKQAGHFVFAFYETKCGKDEMFELKIRLQKQYDDWTKEIEAIRSKYYYMNFLFSDQLYELYTFLKGNTETSTKNETCAMAILKFMGLSTDDFHGISMIYQKYPPPDPDDYITVLDNIGLTLKYISQKTSTTANICKEIGDERKAPFIEKVQSGKPYFAWLDESSSLVIKVLLALYYNTTNILPEANQVLFCNENTTFEEIDLLIRRCNESMRKPKPKTKDLFSIVNVELLKREVQITLIERIRHLSNGDFLLCFICRGNDTHPFLDQFKHSLFKLSPISEAKMDQCFKTHCKHVLVVTSDVPGAGKTELIQNKAINDKKRCKTIHVSGPLNRLSIIEGLLQLELKRYHSLHIDIGTVSDPFQLDLFLFQLIVLRYVSAGSTSYALPCAKIYIEIANSVENTLCDALSTVTAFQREHLKWKNYEDLKVSMEINSPIQVVCRYLKELDECLVDENDLYFNGPNAVKPLTKSTCRAILLKNFNDSSDMSYTLVNVFVRVLADQLKKLSSSLYFQTSSVKAILGKDQPMTVRSQVVKVLVDIARMFADRSVHTCRATQVAFMLSNGDKKLNVEEILAKRVSGMIRWDESNHLMILFHKDIQTISAIYRHLHQVPESIIQLVESQTSKKLTNFDLKETTELENLLIQLAREPDRYISSELLDALRKTYVLTPDNLLKMIIISLRINTRIPVIIMGETGCGKTSLIQYFATICGIELDIVSIHAGTSEENIYSRISLASQKAFSNLNDVFLLFLDEINTCEHLGLITSALCHRFCRDFQLAPNLTLLAACNPYRLRREDSIHTKGLQGKIKTDHLSKLVYRVHPLPETMMDFVWDYGSLSQTDEQAYILKMVERVHFENGMSEMLTNVLVMSQSFVRGKEVNDYCVSLRDVDRCTKLIKWLFDSFLGKKSDTLDIQTRRLHSIILSLAICYQSRFCEGSIREDYRKKK
ncbi:RNF213 [Mytilus coruscus]|uniref:RNF213 n=1 Tax=Mytilus coruscus TaxID=42192 RepID=A0A6J8D646_MYTCO|nr:RNF213 [Mytilus coruscus]